MRESLVMNDSLRKPRSKSVRFHTGVECDIPKSLNPEQKRFLTKLILVFQTSAALRFSC